MNFLLVIHVVLVTYHSGPGEVVLWRWAYYRHAFPLRATHNISFCVLQLYPHLRNIPVFSGFWVHFSYFYFFTFSCCQPDKYIILGFLFLFFLIFVCLSSYYKSFFRCLFTEIFLMHPDAMPLFQNLHPPRAIPYSLAAFLSSLCSISPTLAIQFSYPALFFVPLLPILMQYFQIHGKNVRCLLKYYFPTFPHFGLPKKSKIAILWYSFCIYFLYRMYIQYSLWHRLSSTPLGDSTLWKRKIKDFLTCLPTSWSRKTPSTQLYLNTFCPISFCCSCFWSAFFILSTPECGKSTLLIRKPR